MKDKKLEEEFEVYFKGVNTPDNITGDAKKFVKPKQSFLPKFVKFASVAASFVLVFAVALTIVIKSNLNNPSDGDTSAENPPANAPDAEAPDAAETPGATGTPDDGFRYYTDADISTVQANAYSISSLNGSLKFIENFAVASNASVSTCEVSYIGKTLTLAKAEISVLNGLTRDDATVFVEFTESKLIYDELEEYYGETKNNYRGAEYYLTRTVGENGEPQFKLHISYRGVKYYFNVTSPDQKAYQRYLNLIVK